MAPSPLNGVKLELAVIVCLGVGLWLAAGRVLDSAAAQLAVLALGGVAGAAWVVLRARRILARHRDPAPRA